MCVIEVEKGFVEKVISCLKQSNHPYADIATQQLDGLVRGKERAIQAKHIHWRKDNIMDTKGNPNNWNQDELETL